VKGSVVSSSPHADAHKTDTREAVRRFVYEGMRTFSRFAISNSIETNFTDLSSSIKRLIHGFPGGLR